MEPVLTRCHSFDLAQQFDMSDGCHCARVFWLYRAPVQQTVVVDEGLVVGTLNGRVDVLVHAGVEVSRACSEG